MAKAYVEKNPHSFQENREPLTAVLLCCFEFVQEEEVRTSLSPAFTYKRIFGGDSRHQETFALMKNKGLLRCHADSATRWYELTLKGVRLARSLSRKGR